MKAFAIIGYHHTGKTTTVVNVVKELVSRGFTVATIKDIHSEQYHADKPGKNSALHIKAGSNLAVARGLYDTALIFPRTLQLWEITPHLQADYLVIEGMKDAPVPKIVCAQDNIQIEELADDTAIAISGIVAGTKYKHPFLPVIDGSSRSSELCDLIMAKCFTMLPAADPDCCNRCGSSCYQMAADILQGKRTREDCVLDGKPGISLKVGNKEITIVPFVQDILKDSIMAIINNLRDVNSNLKIEITIKP